MKVLSSETNCILADSRHIISCVDEQAVGAKFSSDGSPSNFLLED